MAKASGRPHIAAGLLLLLARGPAPARAFQAPAAFSRSLGLPGRARPRLEPLGALKDDDVRGFPAEAAPAASSGAGTSDRNAVAVALEARLPAGLALEPTLLAILVVYFVQGALGIAGLTSSLFLKDELGLSPGDMAALTGLFGLPWVIKPLYGLITDRVPIGGLRRRPYLVGAGILGGLGFAALATLVHTPQEALAASLTYNLGIAFSDVVVDSLCVEKARTEAEKRVAEQNLGTGEGGAEAKATLEQDVAAALQSLCWGSRYVGGVLTAAASGPLLEALAPRQVYGITAVFPLLAAAAGFLADEGDRAKPAEAKPAAKASGGPAEMVTDTDAATEDGLELAKPLRELWDTVRRREILLPMGVVGLFLATPSSGSAFFYYLTDGLGLGPSQLGRLQLLTSLASLLGVVAYRTLFAQRRTSTVIAFTSIISVPLGLLQLLLVTHANRDLGIPDGWLIYGDDVFLSALGQLAFMPTLTLAARLCPPGQEGTFFALLMSAYNGSGILGNEISAALTKALGVTGSDFSQLPLLIVICNALSLLPLPLLRFLDEEDDVAEGAAAGEDRSAEK